MPIHLFFSLTAPIIIQWQKSDELFTLTIEVPANTSARVYLLFEGDVTVNGAKLSASVIPGLLATEVHNGKTICKTGSGKYVIQVKL